MKIQKIDNHKKDDTFKSFGTVNKKLSDSIIRSANKTQRKQLMEMYQKELKNPVDAIIYSRYGFLRARLSCPRFIVGFKELHKQIPILESKFSFIKRVVNIVDGYNERLKAASLNKNTEIQQRND